MNNDHRYQYQYNDIDDMRQHSSSLMNDILQRNRKTKLKFVSCFIDPRTSVIRLTTDRPRSISRQMIMGTTESVGKFEILFNCKLFPLVGRKALTNQQDNRRPAVASITTRKHNDPLQRIYSNAVSVCD